MVTMLPQTDQDQERTTLPLDEQPRVFEEAITEADENKLYACVEWLAHLKRKVPLQYMVKKAQIKTTFKAASLSLRDLVAVINAEARRQEQAERGLKPDVAIVAIKWAQQGRQIWGYDDATQIWYKWNGTYWEEQREKASSLDQEAIAALQNAGIAVNSNQTINTFIRVAASYCKRALSQEKSGKINFANGTLDLSTMQLTPFDPGDNFTYCLGYTYTPGGSHPTIDKTLEETIPDLHARQAVIAHIGLSLMRDTSFHNFGLLIGPPRAGKSTILALMNAVCGLVDDPYKFAGPSLFSRDLEGKRSRAAWVDYRGVCVDELPGEALREEELLKLMSAHSGVEMRRIGKDERTDNRWKPKLLLSTNDTPHYKDASGAIRQRAIIIACPNGPRPDNQQDKELINKLLPEIGAFAATCIEYAQALKKHGYYSRSAAMKKLLDEIEHNDPLKAFLRECCIIEPGNEALKITSDQLHKSYAEYVAEGGNSPMAKNKMVSSIRDMHIGVAVGEWMRWNGRPARCLKGIKLRGEFDGDPTEPIYQDDPLFFGGGQPTPPAPSGEDEQATATQTTETEQADQVEAPRVADPLTYTLNYPENMTYFMDPPPEDPCPQCGAKNYAPFWGKYATRKWGCASCYPEIPKRLGNFDPNQHTT
jgi:phage/plasmid-associated DNA primase